MPDTLLIGLGLLSLFLGGNALVKGAARLAASFGISATVVSLTVVAFGTSMPELLVSVSAARQGAGVLALGNILGSNIANIGLVLGLSAVIAPMVIGRRLIRHEIPLLMLVTVAGFALALDGELSALDGVLMIGGFLLFIAQSFRRVQTERQDDREAETPAEPVDAQPASRPRELARLLVGIVLLVLGSQWTVDGATSIARSLGVSELVIGLTLVAFGTALPELSASVIAAWRKKTEIVVGGVIGSNIANVLLILGTTALIRPVEVDAATLRFQYPVMVGFTLLLGVFFFDPILKRWEGLVLLASYIIFIVALFLT